MPQWELTAYN